MTTTQGLVQRQRVAVGDDIDPGVVARVRKVTPYPDDEAIAVRVVGYTPGQSFDINDALMTALQGITDAVNATKQPKDFSAIGESAFVLYSGTLCKVKYAFANVAASQTDSILVAAVGGKSIRVLSYGMMAGATGTNVTFNTKGNGAGVAVSQLFATAANGGIARPYSPTGYFQTNDGQGLSVTTGAGSTVGIDVVYIEIPAIALPPLP